MLIVSFRFLSKPSELAAQLGVSRSWLYDAAKAGRVPSIRIGGEEGPLRFVPEDIQRWIDDARAAWAPGCQTVPTRHPAATDGATLGQGFALPSSARERPAEPSLMPLHGLRDCFLRRDGSSGQDVALQVTVVVLGGADVRVAELALHVHQRVARRQPCRHRRVA